MTAASPTTARAPACGIGIGPMPWGFLLREFRVLLRSRRTKLVLGFMAYAVVAMPVAMAKPPEEIMGIVAQWFGEKDIALKAFLYIWVDMGLNKLIAIVGPILVGGIMAEERAKGTLELFLSKPMTPASYFLAKVLAAALVFCVIYLVGVVGGSVYFPLMVKDFDVGKFLLLSFNHIFAGVFCVAFSATLSLFFRQRVSAMLASVLLLFLLISFGLIGFFNPAWRVWGYFCPFYYGVALFAHFDHLTIWRVIGPTAMLILFSVAVVAVGVWKVSRDAE